MDPKTWKTTFHWFPSEKEWQARGISRVTIWYRWANSIETIQIIKVWLIRRSKMLSRIWMLWILLRGLNWVGISSHYRLEQFWAYQMQVLRGDLLGRGMKWLIYQRRIMRCRLWHKKRRLWRAYTHHNPRRIWTPVNLCPRLKHVKYHC